ncbi:RYamide receptor-like [Anopheles cruzii]|uniref:RYamide receptor-like n=1 Tax=Anopheles cruzii TaxID=68878 RepID=UPI0022EC53D3|nr:RYamide receptor-like [Anopheles cruzii]
MPAGLASPRFQALVYGAYISTLLASVVGNTSVIVIVACPRMGLRTVTNLYLANLALGDLLMTLFCVPFSFVALFVLQYWPFEGAICGVVNYCQAVSVLVSAYTLVAVSADRYRAIIWPLRSAPFRSRSGIGAPDAAAAAGRFRAMLRLGVVWVVAAATAFPIALHSTLVQPSAWHVHCAQSICTEVWTDPAADQAYSLALLLLQFLVPLVVLVYTYGQIGWHLRVGASPPLGESGRVRQRHLRRAWRRTLRTMVAVVSAFIVCWLPFNIFMLVPLDDPGWEPLPYLWFVFHWLAMSHSCYNPLIYCYVNPRFRQAFYALLVRPVIVLCPRQPFGRWWTARPPPSVNGRDQTAAVGDGSNDSD